MYQKLFKSISLLIPTLFILACGEITYDDADKTNTQNSSNQTVENSQNNEATNHSNSEVETAQQANETISGAESNVQKLDDVISLMNTMQTHSSNEAQKTAILNWVEKVATEVNELTNKDFISLVNLYKSLPLYPINDQVFSTNKELSISDNGNIITIRDSFTLVKGDCNTVGIENSVIICTENFYVTNVLNSFVAVKGTSDIMSSGRDNDNLEANPLGILHYGHKAVEGSFITRSIFIGSDPVVLTQVEDTTCINTQNVSTSSGICTDITSSNLSEN